MERRKVEQMKHEIFSYDNRSILYMSVAEIHGNMSVEKCNIAKSE